MAKWQGAFPRTKPECWQPWIAAWLGPPERNGYFVWRAMARLGVETGGDLERVITKLGDQ